MTFELNPTAALAALFVLFLLLGLAIVFFRKSLHRHNLPPRVLPRHQWTRFRPLSLLMGWAASLAVLVVAFSFTRFAKPERPFEADFPPLEEIDVKEIPRTAQEKQTPPTPLPKKNEVLPDDLSVQAVVFENPDPQEPAPQQVVEQSRSRRARPLISPPPRPKEPESGEVFLVVEEPPMFPGCEDISDRDERKRCADQALLRFVRQQIRYPAAARELGIEGLVALRFVVEKDGSISSIQVLRDPGGGLGAEAMRVLKSMPQWQPGLQGGRPVRVQFTLPVRFRLQ